METQRVTRETIAQLEEARHDLGDVAAEFGVDLEESDEGLTDAGWPRERVDGWPIPWISPRRELGKTDEARLQACATGAVCAVCGIGYQADEIALAITSPPDDMRGRLLPGDVVVPSADSDEGIRPIDNGILHRHCARLAIAMCPKLNGLMEDDDLIVLEVVAHTAVPKFLPTGPPGKESLLLAATFAEGTVVELPL